MCGLSSEGAEGEQGPGRLHTGALQIGVVVGDVNQAQGEMGYEVLCRRHHLRRMTSAAARADALSPDVLPVPPEAPLW